MGGGVENEGLMQKTSCFRVITVPLLYRHLCTLLCLSSWTCLLFDPSPDGFKAVSRDAGHARHVLPPAARGIVEVVEIVVDLRASELPRPDLLAMGAVITFAVDARFVTHRPLARP